MPRRGRSWAGCLTACRPAATWRSTTASTRARRLRRPCGSTRHLAPSRTGPAACSSSLASSIAWSWSSQAWSWWRTGGLVPAPSPVRRYRRSGQSGERGDHPVAGGRSPAQGELGPEEPDDSAGTAIDTTVPQSARIWNYWLGGKDHFTVDREVGDQFHEILPGN